MRVCIVCFIYSLLVCCVSKQNNAHSIIKNSYHEEGITRAKEDLSRGILGYYFYGIAIPPYAHTLGKKYGVVVHKEGCSPSGGFEPAYDSVMRNAMIKKFGKDIISELEKEEEISMTPSFPGGNDSLANYLGQAIITHPKGEKSNISGEVVIRFTVDTNGDINDVEIIQALNKFVDKQCVDAVKKMPRWIPGTIGGRRIKEAVNLPIRF